MKHIVQILAFELLFMFTGCITLYKPNSIHSPLLTEKGELSGSAALGLSGSGLYNLQTAYAISNHTGILVDGMLHNRTTKYNDSSYEKLNISFVESGLGYFNKFGNNAKGLFQIYGGGGIGNTTAKVGRAMETNPEVNAKYANIFIQPGIAFWGNNFEIALDTRFNYINLYKIQGNMYDQFEWWNTDFHYYSDTTLNFTIAEPTVTIRAGSENLKGTFQFGLTFPLVNSHSYFMENTSSMLAFPLIKFSMGINYTFGKKERE